MQDKIKKHGQASMEYIMVLSIIMLVFMMVMYIIYEKNIEIIETKTYLDAKSVTNTIVSNINTISEQGNGYYKTFTLPDTLYGGYDYTITIEGNTVELRWGLRPYTYAKSPITANVRGFLVKNLNKVLNCAGDIYVGYPPISCEEAAVNKPPVVNILYPVSGALNCTPFVINGTAVDVNGSVMRVEVSINGGLWWSADNVVQGNETNWTYPFTPTGDGTYQISARAIDEYGAYSNINTVTVNIVQCSDLIPLGGTFKPTGDVKNGTIQTASIDVMNQGVGSSSPFKVTMVITNTHGYSMTYEQIFSSGLSAGGTGTVSTTWNVSSTVDNYTVTITVDSGSSVTEINESNNGYSKIIRSATFLPESVVNFPASGSSFNYNLIKSGLNITGTASDNGGITKVEVHITRTGYDRWFNAAINATGSNASWEYAWTPPGLNGVYLICSTATDNEGYGQTTPYCINVNVTGCVNVTQLNVSRSEWKRYDIKTNNGSACNSTNPCNCTGPVNWTKQGYNDALWATVTLPSPNVTSSCDYCDFYFRKSINVPGSVINASYKFRSDDSMEFWVNEYNISKFGLCHVSGCQPSGSCTGSADNEAVWRNITSYLSKGNNIVAVHVSGCGGQEHFDMIVNVTYNSCDV